MVQITIVSIFHLFVLMVIGILAARYDIIKKEGISSVNGILLRIALPATLIKSFQMDALFANKALIGMALGFGMLHHIVPIALSFLLIRHKRPDVGVERAAVSFTNNMFIGIPLLSSIFGDYGTFIVAATNVAGSFMLFGFAMLLITGKFSFKAFIKEVCNDKVGVSIFSLCLLMLNIHIPDIVLTPIGYIAEITTPLAMFSIGANIAQADIKSLFTGRVMYLSFLRLIVLALAECFVAKFITHDLTTLLCVSVIAGTPTGSMIPVLSGEAGFDTRTPSGVFIVTTIFSAITIPFIVFIMNSI